MAAVHRLAAPSHLHPAWGWTPGTRRFADINRKNGTLLGARVPRSDPHYRGEGRLTRLGSCSGGLALTTRRSCPAPSTLKNRQISADQRIVSAELDGPGRRRRLRYRDPANQRGKERTCRRREKHRLEREIRSSNVQLP